jgi:nucleotidyltransferase/DNA polymerase involved in DNA repair
MASSGAKRLCPHAVFVRPRFGRYQEISKKIRTIFREYADKVEPPSLDEAYLNVTGHALYAILVRDAVIQNLTSVLQDLNDDMKRLSLNPRMVTLKLKYFDFESIMRRKTTPRPLHKMEDVWKVLLELLSDQSLTESKRIRLVGCSLSQFEYGMAG